MKPSRLLFTVAMLALTLLFTCAVLTATAAAKKPATPPPPPDMRKLIKSVDVAGGSVVILYVNSKLLHTYRVDDNTAVTVNNIAGKITAIKPGMEVTSYLERDNDDLDAITLQGSGATPAPAAAAPKASPKPKPKTN